MISRIFLTLSGFSLRPSASWRCFSTASRIEGRKLKRSEEHTSELQSQSNLVCRLLLEKKKKSCVDGQDREEHGIWHCNQMLRLVAALQYVQCHPPGRRCDVLFPRPKLILSSTYCTYDP